MVRVRLFTGIFNNKRELATVLSDNSGPILPVGGGWPQFVCIKTAAPWLSETATKRIQPMTRKFIAAVVGAALAITAVGAAPARADQDLVRALAAIAGIAIVGKVIKDKIEGNDNRVSRNRYDDRYYDVRPGYHSDRDVIRRVTPRPLPHNVRRRLLPGECLRSFRAHDRRYRVFGIECLERNYDYTRSLPRACEVRFRAEQKKRRGYDARCLRDRGYQLARR